MTKEGQGAVGRAAAPLEPGRAGDWVRAVDEYGRDDPSVQPVFGGGGVTDQVQPFAASS
jgi:hypothetical protein